MTKTTNGRPASRNDVHSPASADFDPDLYSPEFFVDFHSEDGNSREMWRFVKPFLDNGWKRGPHFSTHQCGHCGRPLRYAAVMFRDDVKEIILVGETCLDNRFELSKAEFQALREAGKLNAERRTRNERMAALFEAEPMLVDLTYLTNISELNWSDFLGDMYRALKGGWITEKQVAAAVKTIAKMSANYWRREAERIAREANAKPVEFLATEGAKVTVSGKVTHVFEGTPFSYYGPVPMTYIVEGDGFVVKISTTSKTFDDVERGSEIKVSGTVKAHKMYRDVPQTVLTRAKVL